MGILKSPGRSDRVSPNFGLALSNGAGNSRLAVRRVTLEAFRNIHQVRTAVTCKRLFSNYLKLDVELVSSTKFVHTDITVSAFVKQRSRNCWTSRCVILRDGGTVKFFDRESIDEEFRLSSR